MENLTLRDIILEFEARNIENEDEKLALKSLKELLNSKGDGVLASSTSEDSEKTESSEGTETSESSEDSEDSEDSESTENSESFDKFKIKNQLILTKPLDLLKYDAKTIYENIIINEK